MIGKLGKFDNHNLFVAIYTTYLLIRQGRNVQIASNMGFWVSDPSLQKVRKVWIIFSQILIEIGKFNLNWGI